MKNNLIEKIKPMIADMIYCRTLREYAHGALIDSNYKADTTTQEQANLIN